MGKSLVSCFFDSRCRCCVNKTDYELLYNTVFCWITVRLFVALQSIQNCDSPGHKRDSLRLQKDSLKQQQVDAEQTILDQHRSFLDLELRKLRRCKLLQMHLLDQSLLSEVCLAFYT